MIDLVAFDLDGTVLDSESRIQASALKAIEALIARGVPTASVSGRSIRRCQEPFAAYPELARALYVGGYNGGVVVGPEEDGARAVLHEERLDEGAFLKLVEYGQAEGLNLIYCLFAEDGSGIVEEYRHVAPVDHLEVLGGLGFAFDGELYARCLSGELGPPPKIMFVVEPARREAVIADIAALCGEQIYTAWSIADRVEIMRAGVDKGVAIRALAERVGTEVGRVLAVGDGDNDLPMLQVAGVGVLMGNAKEEVRAMAEGVEVGAGFAEGGFAKAVKEYVLDG